MLNRVPSLCSHTATALPPPSSASEGLQASPASSASISTALPHPTPAAYRLAQTLARAPSVWDHTAITLPSRSAEMAAPLALPSSVSTSTAGLHDESETRLAHRLYRLPS